MTWLGWGLAIAFCLLVAVSVVASMGEIDTRRRRAYLGLCIYCGEPRHDGRMCRDA